MEEKCPKCGSPVIMAVTRAGKRMKKCSTNTWNAELKKAEGCDFIEWIGGTTEALDEDCPLCGNKLVFYTTSTGKQMKKCSTGGWDKDARKATGCTYVQWMKPGENPRDITRHAEEPLPQDPNA